MTWSPTRSALARVAPRGPSAANEGGPERRNQAPAADRPGLRRGLPRRPLHRAAESRRSGRHLEEAGQGRARVADRRSVPRDRLVLLLRRAVPGSDRARGGDRLGTELPDHPGEPGCDQAAGGRWDRRHRPDGVGAATRWTLGSAGRSPHGDVAGAPLHRLHGSGPDHRARPQDRHPLGAEPGCLHADPGDRRGADHHRGAADWLLRR